jgi:hypothetical protein
MADTIKIRAGDTEPLTFAISGRRTNGVLENLEGLDTATFYVRRLGQVANHVTGGELTVAVSADRTLTFDPVDAKVGDGNAFDERGLYDCYALALWDDGRETRHPGEDEEDEFLRVEVIENYE